MSFQVSPWFASYRREAPPQGYQINLSCSFCAIIVLEAFCVRSRAHRGLAGGFPLQCSSPWKGRR